MDEKLVYVTPLFAPPTREQVDNSLSPFTGLINAYKHRLLEGYREAFGTAKITANGVLAELGELKIVGRNKDTSFPRDCQVSQKESNARNCVSYKETPTIGPSPSIFDKVGRRADIEVNETQFPSPRDDKNQKAFPPTTTTRKSHNTTKATLPKQSGHIKSLPKKAILPIAVTRSDDWQEKKIVSQNPTEQINKKSDNSMLKELTKKLSKPEPFVSSTSRQFLDDNFHPDAEVIIPKFSLRRNQIESQNTEKNYIHEIPEKKSQTSVFKKNMHQETSASGNENKFNKDNYTQIRNSESSKLNLQTEGHSISQKEQHETETENLVIDLTTDTCERAKPDLTYMTVSDDEENAVEDNFNSFKYVSKSAQVNRSNASYAERTGYSLEKCYSGYNHTFDNNDPCGEDYVPKYEMETCNSAVPFQQMYYKRKDVCTLSQTACSNADLNSNNHKSSSENGSNFLKFNTRFDSCTPLWYLRTKCDSSKYPKRLSLEDENLMSVSPCDNTRKLLYEKSCFMKNDILPNNHSSKLEESKDIMLVTPSTPSPVYSPLTSLNFDVKSNAISDHEYVLPSQTIFPRNDCTNNSLKDSGPKKEYHKCSNNYNNYSTTSNQAEDNKSDKIIIHSVVDVLPEKEQVPKLCTQKSLDCAFLKSQFDSSKPFESMPKKQNDKRIISEPRPIILDKENLPNKPLNTLSELHTKTSTITKAVTKNPATGTEETKTITILKESATNFDCNKSKFKTSSEQETEISLNEGDLPCFKNVFEPVEESGSDSISPEDWCISQDFIGDLFGMEMKLKKESIKVTLKNCQKEDKEDYFDDIQKERSPPCKKIKCKSSPSRIKKQPQKCNTRPSGKSCTLKATSNTKITDFFASCKTTSELTRGKYEEQPPPKRKSNTVRAVSSTRKKQKFLTPAVSQLEEIEPIADVFLLRDQNAIELLDKLNLESPCEICFDVMFDNQLCQLSQPSTFKKPVTPVGLMFSVQWKPADDVEFYYMSTFSNWSNIENARRLAVRLLAVDPACTLVCYDAKRLYVYLRAALEVEAGAGRGGAVCDVLVGCWLLDPDRPAASFGGVLAALGMRGVGRVTSDDPALAACPLLRLLGAAGREVRRLLRARGLWALFADVETAVVGCLAAMESRGIMVLEEELANSNAVLQERLKVVERDAHGAAGVDFKISSTVQLRRILYDVLELDKKTSGCIGTTAICGEKSTSEDTLLVLRGTHPLPELVLEFRHIQKARSTYVDAIAKCSSNSIVRATWTQTGTATGRISCSNPNLQAIPKGDFPLVLFPAKKQPPPPHLNLRSSFVARPSFTFISADFRHIEFRVFASLAQDEKLLKLLTSEEDVFLSLSRLLGDEDLSVPNERREKTKKFVYAIIYGAGVSKLKEILGCGLEETRSIKERFGNKFRAFRDFGRLLVAEAQRRGYLRSLSGRRRLFPNIRSAEAGLRRQAERQAVNFVIQGSAADICKAVMVESENILRKKYSGAYHLVLQIHDELVWEVSDRYLQEISAELQKLLNGGQTLCEKFPELKVPLPVNICTGKKWGELEKLSV